MRIYVVRHGETDVNLENRINSLNDDDLNETGISQARMLGEQLKSVNYDLIICNPPYFKVNEETKKNDNKIKSIARHEIEITLDDIIKLSRKLLKNNGSLVLVHRPERLSEIIVLMEKYNISPKRIQFIYPKENTESNMIIIEGTKNGNNALKVVEPLIIHEENGDYRKEIENIFKGC